MEKRECSLCGGKLGRLTKTQLQDGYYCVKCDVKLNKLGLETNKSWYPIQYTVQEVTEVLNDANPTAIVEKMHEEHAKKMSLNNTCLICGKKLKVESGYMTADGRVLCLDCRNAAITISPDEFLVNKDAYIHHHNSDFFIENMKHMEYPSPQLAVNFTLRRFFYRGQLFDSPDCVFPFESVIKFESDACTYQVTEGKKGHPIARALVGGAAFGGAGAVVGAMTSKNTRHKETKVATYCIHIYQKDPTEKSGVRKRDCYGYTRDETGIVNLEECLKRVFECQEEEKQLTVNTEGEKSEAQNNYAELFELKKLLDIGAITQDEYDIKKKAILNL